MSKYPLTDGPTERAIRAAQILKSIDPDYFADVIRTMMSKEKATRHQPTKRKKKMEVALHGKRVRGGKVFIDLSNVEIIGVNHP